MQIEEKNTYRIRYLITPDYAFQNRKLLRLSAELYSFIHGYRGNEFFFANDKLSALFQCSERSISRALTQLQEEGFIKCEQPNGRKRYIIDLWVDRVVYPGSTDVSTHVEADGSTRLSTHNSPKPQQNEAKDEDFGVPNKNINNNTLANFENTDETDETSEEVQIPNNLDSILPLKREKKLKVIPCWGKPNPRPALTPLQQRQQDYKLKERGGVDATNII